MVNNEGTTASAETVPDVYYRRDGGYLVLHHKEQWNDKKWCDDVSKRSGSMFPHPVIMSLLLDNGNGIIEMDIKKPLSAGVRVVQANVVHRIARAVSQSKNVVDEVETFLRNTGALKESRTTKTEFL